MSRLADYFAVVGYDHEKDRSGTGKSVGKIIQKFPEKDWDNCVFTQGIELFCQPTGWELSLQRQQPTFTVSVLTDVDADRHYCACFTFHETVAMTPTKPDDADGDEPESSLVHHSLMFAPKSLLLISTLDYFETFRHCLGIIYSVYIENLQVQLETLVGNILGCVQVPPPGGPQVRFSIGAGDRQALQPPLNSTIPCTRTTIALLFQQMGIQNVISLFCATLTDHKILFYSRSYTRLTDASQALIALIYPLKYSYVYIPILPAHLLEVLNTPTPFIAGIHSSLLQEKVQDLLDVILVDLDGGSVRTPECVTLIQIPEVILARTVESLNFVLNPDLLMADFAFPTSPKKTSSAVNRDKEIRAIFVRLFAELLQGYRSCLTIIRIHPDPFITFHKANFLGHRGMVDDEFTLRVLEGMSFSAFVAERGPPYRVCDIFDEVYASMQDSLKEEKTSTEKLVEHIKDLANLLYQHECPNPQPYVQKVPKPTEGAYARIHQPPFPYLDAVHVQQIIDEGIAKHSIKSKLKNVKPHQPCIVPAGPPITSVTDKLRVVDNNARRMEVLRNCVSCIFDNKISDARKIFPAVLRALKRRVARHALTQELSFHVQSNRAMLEHQQFDLVVRLLNSALQNDSNMDENGTAAAILPLAMSFCRKLCTGVIQFAYTCIQEHAVWCNHQFWEATFYQDVQVQIRQLYVTQYEEQMGGDHSRGSSRCSTPRESMELGTSWGRASSSSNSEIQRRSTSSPYKPREITALEIAAEQLRVWPSLSKEQQEEMIANEESTVYSQAIHYANRMVYLRVPLDANKHMKTIGYDLESNSNSNVTASIAESDSVDAESGFDETESSEVGANVIKFVTRFVDKVCNESGVTQDHIKSLHQMIPGVVAMHIETLEGVFKESKRLPPIQKPKILTPALLPGEDCIMEGLRAYLIPDGRDEGTGIAMGGPTLLPAEGAVFLTTYRIIFKGTPCDPLACEQIVIRSFPVATLTKEKRISGQYLPYLNQWLQEGLQMRANIFQLIKVCFDEEVGSDNVETFRKLVNKVRNPPSVFATFAFSGPSVPQPTPHHKQKEKNASLKQFAKKTFIKTARKAGIKSKQSGRKSKYVLPTPPMSRKNGSPRGSDSESDRPRSELYDEDLSIIDESEFSINLLADPKALQRLMERPGYKDYQRLDLGSLSTTGNRAGTDAFRITVVNANFSTCRSYPALVVVPQSVTDESVRRFSRCHRQCRFPVITWRHPRTKALLLRASGFHSRGLMGMIKHQSQSTTSGEVTSGSSIEQEKYFKCLVAATPISSRLFHTSSYSDSLTSLDSLMMAGTSDTLTIPETPDTMRRTAFGRVLSKGKARTIGRMGSFKEKSRLSTASLDNKHNHSHQNGSIDPKGDFVNSSIQGLNKFSLYVLGEKTQMKGIKVESFPKCDFIPVDFYDVRHVKASFKKLMRACVPSAAPASDQPSAFYKALEESEWLLQIQNVLQLAGATVDLMDVQGSSVMICLEDGWDITTQVVAVAQIMMDPVYRTMEGFRVLIEKEWLSFGHRFTHRSNQTAANQASGFAPVFLQFLDVIHQIHVQFPCSFEFNQYFLKFMAYHYVSNRFRTFMLDNEFERMEAGWLLEEKKGPKLGTPDEEAGFSPKHQTNMGMSLWDYIDKLHRKSPIFLNFHYSPMDQELVLRPYSNVSNLKIWEYYLTEDLAHGPSYDVELATKELQQIEEPDGLDTSLYQRRKILNGCYNNIAVQQPSIFTELFREISRLENELGHLPQKWKPVFEKLESPHEHLNRQISLTTQLVRSHGRSIHKRSTLEILVRGKMLGVAARSINQPHRFETFTYTTPVYCDHCSHVLWGLVKTVSAVGMQCQDCGYNCHDKCMPYVPKSCTKLKAVPSSSSIQNLSNLSKGGVSDSSSVTAVGSIASGSQIYDHFTPNVSEHRTHEGYLYKRGALLKGWKQRWFVLDSHKHQLRYYDAMEDSNCKGYIDLAEVVSVQAIKNVQSAPKKADENAFFEMKTMKRVYHFLAMEAKTAQDWIDKIQSCIQ